jgi:uncharacterized repeat protein (TIGR01451 family)/fimbrial isopeptide formation D2 family protein
MDDVTITKSDNGVTTAAIGDDITYNLNIISPQGTVSNLIVTDVLDAGFIYNGDATITNGGASVSLTPTTITGPVDGSGEVTLIWDLGDFVVNTDDPVLIQYTATVADVVANVDGVALNNSASIIYDDAQGDPVAPAAVSDDLTIGEASIHTVKTVDMTSGVEAGDVLTYTVTVTNSGNNSAYEVFLHDTLAPGTSFGSVVSSTIDGTAVAAVTGIATTVVGDDTIITFTNDDWDVAPTEVLTVVYTVNVTSAALVDGTHTNSVDADWTSHDGSPAEDRIYDEDDGIDSPVDDGIHADNDVDDAVFSMDDVTITKSDNGVSNASVGDVITYSISIASPRGTISNLQVIDTLSAGLIYNDDVTITTASGWLTIGAGLKTPVVTGDDSGLAEVILTWNLADVIVDSDDPVIIEYTATVADVSGNIDGVDLFNEAEMSYDDAQGAQVAPAAVSDDLTIVEPWISVEKTVDKTSGVEAGDVLTYTVVMTNGGTGTAYEVNFLDTLAPGTSFGAVTSAMLGTTDVTAETSVTSSDGGSVMIFANATWDLAPAETLTVVYSINVTTAAAVDGTHTNSVDVDWSSQEGSTDHDRVYDEDDGIDSPVDDGINADRDLDTEVFTMDAVTITKTDGGTATATIGDVVTYSLLISSPRGTITDLVVTDVLSAGLIYNEDVTITTANGTVTIEAGHTVTPVYSINDGSAAVTLSWDLGDVIVESDDPVLIQYSATVANVTPNFEDEVLSNSVEMSYVDAQGNLLTPLALPGDTYSDDLVIVEPSIHTYKTVDKTTGVEAGDVLTYTVAMSNGGASTAYEVNLHDTLAQGTSFGTVTSAMIGTSDVLLGTAVTFNGDGSIDFTNADWDVAPTEVLTLVYTVSVDSDARVDGTHTNSVDADWSGQDGSQPTERIYDEDDGIDSPVDDGVHGDRDLDTAVFTMDDVTLAKTDNGVTIAAVGDEITYTLSIDSPRGTITNLVVTDVLTAGLIYNGDVTITTTTGSVSFETGHSATPTFGVNDGSDVVTLVWDLGDVFVDSDDPIVIEYTVTVADLAGNALDVEHNNNATISYDSAQGDPIISNPVSDDFIVGEPIITTTKVIAGTPDGDTAVVEIGDIIEYTVVLTNTGTTEAFEVTALDTLAEGTTYYTDATHQPVATIGDVPVGLDITDNITSLSITSDADGWDLAVGESVVLTYFVYVGDSYYPDDNTNNTASTVDADWSSQDGAADPHDRIYDDGEANPLQGVDGTQDTDSADFEIIYTGSIGDTVFFDASGDGGVFNAADGDVGMGGVDVILSADLDGDGTDDFIRTVRTNADGQYLFANLPRFDQYIITVDTDTTGGVSPRSLDAAGLVQTFDKDGISSASVAVVDLSVGAVIDDVDFGYTGTSAIGDTVWYDIWGDSVQDADDVYLAGVTVTLTGDMNYDGIVDTISTVTDVNGKYSFDLLPAGDFTVAVDMTTMPGGMTGTYDADGIITPDSSFIALGVGELNTEQDFGYWGTGSIGDFIWFDANNNGIQDEGLHSGLNNVEVSITGADLDGDGIADYSNTVFTDVNGLYLFEHLPGGSYTVTVNNSSLPGGSVNWVQSYDQDGVLDDSVTLNVPFVDNGSNEDGDFGYMGTGSIGDMVWVDTDGDGAMDPDELPMVNVLVSIAADVDGDSIVDYLEVVETDENGMFLFENLPTAEYTIALEPVSLPDGAYITYDLDSAVNSPDGTVKYSLGIGQNTDDVDFGVSGKGSLGGLVWNDDNADGIQDIGETGMAGITVTLTGDLDNDGLADDTVTAVTDASGGYSFTDLFTGDYTITVDSDTLVAGMTPSYDPDDAVLPFATPHSGVVTLTLDDLEQSDVNFGYTSKSAIGDKVWYDLDGDGVEDAGELGLSGVEVTLSADFDGDGTVDFTDTAVTDSDGHYLFNGLTAGTYSVSLDSTDLPDGMIPSYDRDGVATPFLTEVVLGSAAAVLDADFGVTGVGLIGDRIWDDLNGDGIQDAGESGIAGITVTLTGDFDNDGVADDILTTLTASDGRYSFAHLAAGDYTVTVDSDALAPGMVPTFDYDGIASANSVDLTLGGVEPMVNNDIDFGYAQAAGIGDSIWYDINGDGVQDAGEYGLAGITVTLTGDTDNDGFVDVTMSTTTDGDGNYFFAGLVAGDYTISTAVGDLPPGAVPTYDADGTGAGSVNSTQLTLATNEVNLDTDFGYTGAGSIGDLIWNDVNNNGIQDGSEAGIAGVTVQLFGDFDNDGSADDSISMVTGSDGSYLFENLLEGAYTVAVDTASLPSGMLPVYDGDGIGTLNTVAITLGGSEPVNNLDADFGYQQTTTIGDTVWFDTNGDGVQDPDEPGLAGVTVILHGDIDGDGQLDDTLKTVTDANGQYFFDQLFPGDFVVYVATSSLPGGVEPTYDYDGIESPNVVHLTPGVTAGEALLEVDFGYAGTGSIGDTVWYDADDNGVQDSGEVGLKNVTVTLIGDIDRDGIIDTVSTTTDSNGEYLFEMLPAGEYTIEIDITTMPGGMTASFDADGIATPDSTVVILGADEQQTDIDFGYTGTGSIGNTIWEDRNRDGVRNSGEPGIGGIELSLGIDLDGDGQADYTKTVTTDNSGYYIFDNLPEGAHLLTINPETLPAGMDAVYDPDGVLDNGILVNLGAGQLYLSANFGYAYPVITVDVGVGVGIDLRLEYLDAMYMYKFFSESDDPLFPVYYDTEIPDYILPVSPLYTGTAEPGTTLCLSIYDADGNVVGFETVMADTAGNWLASFPGTLLYDLPHHMEIEQTISAYNTSTEGLFNMRTYFNPNFSSMMFSAMPLDTQAIFAYLPSVIMESVHQSNMSSISLEWNSFHGYEFIAPSVNPAKLGH